MKLIVCFVGFDLRQLVMALLMISAMVLSIYSCRQWYSPSPRAFGKQLKMCSRVPFLCQREHAGVSTKPKQLDRLRKTWWTAWTKKLMRCGSALQRSVHEIFVSTACSHLLQATCCLTPTALLDVYSSAIALTSFWTSCRRSFPRAWS